MRCPKCGTENPEGKMFCGDCGSALPQPPAPPSAQPAQPTNVLPKPSWIRSNWKGLVSVVVVVLVVLSVVGLVYTQPWSKIVVQVDNQTGSSMIVNMDIDNSPRTSTGQRQTVGNESAIDGTWTFTVSAGNHLLWISAAEYSDMYFTLVSVGPLSHETVLITLTWYDIEGP